MIETRECKQGAQYCSVLILCVLVGLTLPARAIANSDGFLLTDQRITIVDLTTDAIGKAAVQRLATYLETCLGNANSIVNSLSDAGESRAHGHALIVIGERGVADHYAISPPSADSDESYAIVTLFEHGPVAVISGTTSHGVKRGVQRFIFRTQQLAPGELWVPATDISEKPWKSTREYMLSIWSPNDVRAKFSNRNVNKKIDVMYRYSDEQLNRYVQMFDQLGFTGVQLGEVSVSWGIAGSMEAYQDRIRKIAQVAHSLGQKVSYIFWAASFNVGWPDIEMDYEPEIGKSAFEDRSIRSYFEKYYDHYANMAPHVDLVISHWFDSGQLTSIDDVIDYQKLLKEKMLIKNPNLQFAVNTWGHPDFFDALIDAGMNDHLLLETSMPWAVSKTKRNEFRRRAKENGFEIGVWGWYMTEYETDQVPNMYVNGHVVKEYISTIKNGAEAIHPSSYWSEMEAYHIANIYTMYQTSQLLWNPDRDPDELLNEITGAIWGPRDSHEIFDALKLIEEVRSGDSYKTFSYLSPDRVDGTINPDRTDGTHDPAADARRAAESLKALATMTPDPEYVPKITLPVSRETLLELMLPHLEQIRRFAEFRLAFEDVEKMAKRDVAITTLQSKVAEIWQPIPELDTWIGTYGQAEAWRQAKMLFDFCEEIGISPPVPSWKRVQDQRRFLEAIESMQRVESDVVTVTAAQLAAEFGGIYANETYAKQLLDELVEDQFLEQLPTSEYQLLRWQDAAFLIRSRLGLDSGTVGNVH